MKRRRVTRKRGKEGEENDTFTLLLLRTQYNVHIIINGNKFPKKIELTSLRPVTSCR